MSNENELLAAALAYAARGWPVIPLHHVEAGGACSCGRPDCKSPGKHPRTPHGLADASTDAAAVLGWWAKWPRANVAVVTGPASGVWVLGPDGAEGLADLARLAGEHGPLPETARAATGSGGAHLYFRWPADGLPIPNRRNHRGLRIDVRGCGDGPGYAVAPPSANGNGPYVWQDVRDPAEAPAWLLAWVRGSVFRVTAGKPPPSVLDRARAYLDKCPGAVAGQDGHGQTFKVARALVWGFNLPEAVALDLLLSHYNPRCEPPWTEKELRHKVSEAATKDYGKPRGYLLGDRTGADRSGQPGRNSGDSGDGNQGEGLWTDPSPLPEMPAVPPFPLAVFPRKVASYWAAAARSLAVPVDYVGVPGLALLGAAVGRSRAASVKKGYAEPPSLWAAVIAPPGATKSASLRAAGAPLAWAEARWLDQHKHAVNLFDTEMDRYAQRMKEWKANGCNGEPPQKPTRPTLRQVILDNTTTEAAAKVLAENPRGIAVVKDELIGFLRSMNQYKGGKGEDRQFWLSSWAGQPAKVNRSKDHAAGPLVIPTPFVGVAGMMCPDSLPELRGEMRPGEGAADGFVDRFLFSFPDPIPATGETWDEVPDELREGYATLFADLLGVEMVPESGAPGEKRHRPYFIPFGDEARKEWEQFTTAMAGKKNALDRFDPFRGVLAKLQGYAVRIGAVLWAVRRANGELTPNAPMDAETLSGAVALVEYFEAHGRRCLGAGWADRTCRVAKRMLSWLAGRKDLNTFSRTEAFQQLKDRRDVTSSDALAGVFRMLTDHGYIRPIDPSGSGRPGPVPELYAVNPRWVR